MALGLALQSQPGPAVTTAAPWRCCPAPHPGMLGNRLSVPPRGAPSSGDSARPSERGAASSTPPPPPSSRLSPAPASRPAPSPAGRGRPAQTSRDSSERLGPPLPLPSPVSWGVGLLTEPTDSHPSHACGPAPWGSWARPACLKRTHLPRGKPAQDQDRHRLCSAQLQPPCHLRATVQ